MPNHFHLALWPKHDGNLSRWMHWLLSAHVRRYHQHYQSSGHIWKGRFKAFPIEKGKNLLTVLRFIERNPLRAKFVRKAESWRWSSARHWRDAEGRPSFLVSGPARRPIDWLGWIKQPETKAELDAVRHSVKRGTPFGSEAWVARTVEEMGLESTLRPQGRPRKTTSKTGDDQ
jgi:putative transposase